MRKIQLLLLATLLSAAVLAQGNINKRNLMAGGRIAFSSTSVSGGGGSSTSFEASPNFGYFVADQFAVGTELSYSSGGGDKIFLFSPFFRYYFLEPSQKVNVFGQASFGFGTLSSSFGGSTSVNQFSFAAGPAIFLNPSVALEFGLGYASLGGGGGGSRLNTIALYTGFQIHLAGKGR